MSEYYTVITEKGIEILTECIENGAAFPASIMKVGDSNGSYYEPSDTQTALKNVKYTGELYAQGKKNGYLYFDLQLPPSEGNYYIREVGLFDNDDNLIAVAKYPESYKQKSDDGSSKSLLIEIQILLSNEALNTIVIDDSANLATIVELENYQKLDEKGEANGYASLDENGKVPSEQLPQTDSGADTNLSNLTATGLSRYNVFCVNTGNTDSSGNPAFLTASGGTNSTLTSASLEDRESILNEFAMVEKGSMVISLNNETYTVSGLDFSEVEDLAGVAKILQTAIRANTEGGALWTGAAVTCSEDDEEDTVTFTLTAGLIGAYDIGYATAAEETEEETQLEPSAIIAGDISSLIGWSEADEPTITTGEALTLTTTGSFDVTTANGTIYTISDTLEFTADNLGSGGAYKIFIDPVNKSISLTQNEITAGSAFPADAATGDYLLNTSQIPYDLQKKTDSGVTKGLNEVYAGVLTLSGGGNLVLNSYNSDFLKAHEIGEPQISLTGKLNENEIWLEGAEVSKSAYPLLYLAYGDTYGTAENDDNFVLPDFRGRVIQGADGFGYLEAGLPDITGSAYGNTGTGSQSFGEGVTHFTDAFSSSVTKSIKTVSDGDSSSTGLYNLVFNASDANSIYGNSSTVQPPAIKVRVKTKYKI